jgi:hypothetical protein
MIPEWLLATLTAGALSGVVVQMQEYPDVPIRGDRSLLIEQDWRNSAQAQQQNGLLRRWSTQMPYAHQPGVLLSGPPAVWTRLVMTPQLCVVVAGTAVGKRTITAVSQSVAPAVGSPNCRAEIHWAQAAVVRARQDGRSAP